MHLIAKKFYLFIIFISFGGQSLAKELKAPDVTIYKSFNIPLEQVSGIGIYEELASEKYKIYAVGDQESSYHLSSWYKTTIDKGAKEVLFRDIVNQRFSPCTSANKHCKELETLLNSDWEAIQLDGQGWIYLLQEHSGLIFILDSLGEYAADIKLDYDPLYKSYEAKTKLRTGRRALGEGLVLMRGGHVLIAYQDDPPLVVEYGPKGKKALGVKKKSFLSRVQSFTLPRKDDLQTRFNFVPLKYWEIAGLGDCDLNELFYDTRSNRLFAASKSCNAVLHLEPHKDVSKGDMLKVSKKWQLPKKIRFLEGMLVLPDGKWLVVGDYRKKTVRNAFILDAVK